MIDFVKAHAYGNDFLYVEKAAVRHVIPAPLARAMCDRHTGIGADGLILYAKTSDGATMSLFNADGGRAEVSGNGLRGLAAILLNDVDDPVEVSGFPSTALGAGSRTEATVTIHTEAGDKRLTRIERSGARQTFRATMGSPVDLRQVSLMAGGERLQAVTLNIGNPQCVLLGPLPDDERFQRLGPAIERHSSFPDGTNVEFAAVEGPDRVRILIWERGCGATHSSGTGSCAAAVAAAAFGGASRDVEIVAPGGSQRVEWLGEGVYLTGWAEVIAEGRWFLQA
jgi:diaminopimelate epimerase